MTITSTVAQNNYVGSGSTGPFAFTFKIFLASHLYVYTTDLTGSQVQLNYPTDFSISSGSIGAKNGGTITLTNALTTGWQLTIERNVPNLQLTDLRNQGDFFPETYEDALDYMTMITQQLMLTGGLQGAVIDKFEHGSDFTAGTTTVLTLSQIPAGAGSLTVTFDSGSGGVVEHHSHYTVVGKTITFASAIPLGVLEVQAQYFMAVLVAGQTDLVLSVKSYGAKGDGTTDDTAAFTTAIAAAAANTPNPANVYAPTGQYVIKSQLTIPTQVSLIGDGASVSVLVFTPSGNGTCVLVSAGAAQSLKNRVTGIGFYSADTTHTKVALQLSDVTSCLVDDIYIFGTCTGTPSAPYWHGANSVGIQTNGREASSISNIRVCADIPVLHAANPNTTATNGEDLDHWHLYNWYLVALGHPCVVVADGLGIMQCTYDGYQAWVGGTDGFHLNDTRIAPTVPTRGLSFHNVRREQSQTATAYAFNMVVAPSDSSASTALDVTLDKCFADSDSAGIASTGFLQNIVRGCVMASPSGKNSLLMAGARGGATIDMQGCYWQPGSTFTTTGYNLLLATAFDASVTVGPSTALYANVVAGSLAFIEKITGFAAAGVRAIIAQATASGDQVNLMPLAAGSGGQIRAENNAETDFTPLAILCKTLGINIRTGLGTSATVLSLDTSGNLIQASGKNLQLGTTYNAAVPAAGSTFKATGTIQITDQTGTSYYIGVNTSPT